VDEWIELGNGERRRIAGRTVLHQGNNGNAVERIWLPGGESFILKPLTNDGQHGREKWVYEHVLPMLPPVYPRLIARSPEEADERGGWLLLEDLGTLEHTFREDAARELVERIAGWHALPAHRWANAPLRGPKPRVERMLEELRASARQDGTEQERRWLREAAERLGGVSEWWRRDVFSHGDLHLGNYAAAGGGVRVLDWEHAHPNSPYWDLYHAIDLSHPLHPREVVEEAMRTRLLEAYADEAERLGDRLIPERAAFLREYRLFAAIFSWWMLKLIEKNLREDRGLWPADRLRAQWRETHAVWAQCVGELAGR